jgi:hypothetical protein
VPPTSHDSTQTVQRTFSTIPAKQPTAPVTAQEGFGGLCGAPTGVARSSSYASNRLANAVLVPMPRMSNGACFTRYVRAVPWGVSLSGSPAQRAGRRNAQRTYCDAQSGLRLFHFHCTKTPAAHVGTLGGRIPSRLHVPDSLAGECIHRGALPLSCVPSAFVVCRL